MNWDPYSEFRSATFSNGLEIHALKMDRPWQRLNVVVHSGSVQDSAGKEGTAHFVEHLVSKNTTTSYEALRDYFNNNGGGAMFGATNFWNTQYRFFIPKKEAVMAQSLEYFGEMLLGLKLKRNIERERDVILNEFIKKYPITFRYDIELRAHKALHAGLPLERILTPLGSSDTIKVITEEDVQEYYDTNYTPKNMSIVAVGGYSLEEICDFLSESRFAVLMPGERKAMRPLKRFPKMPENFLELKLSDYVALSAIEKFASYESSFKIPLSISETAISILGGMLNELLDHEIRQKEAWTYNIRTSSHFYVQYYKFNVACSSFSLKAVDLIEERIDSIITSIPSNEGLFKKIKKNKLAGVYMSDEDGSTILTEAVTDLFYRGGIKPLTASIENIERVTFAEVCSILQFWKKENRWTMITRP